MTTTTFAILLVLCAPAALAQLNSTQQAEASKLINEAIKSTNNTRPWYETWTPNAPAYLTYNATLPDIWITGVMGTALRTSMSVLVRDSIQYSQVWSGGTWCEKVCVYGDTLSTTTTTGPNWLVGKLHH